MKIMPGGLLFTIILFAGIYCIIVLLAYWFQDKLTYIPGRAGRDQAEWYGLQPWPDAIDFHGYRSKSELDAADGTILIWHGNAGTALDRGYYINALEARDFRVLLVEFPGYGDRDGAFSEKSFVDDAMIATEKAIKQFKGPFILWGESMGCAVASKVALHFRMKIAGLVLVTPWANLPDVGQAVYPFLPVKLLAKDRYDNIENLKNYNGKVFIAMAEYDEVIPPAHTKKLFDAISADKRLWLFKGAGHNSWPFNSSDAWWDEIFRFLL